MIDGLRPYPKMRPTSLPWLGDLPAHWTVMRVKTLLKEVDNRSSSGEERLLSLRMRQGLVDHALAGGKFIPSDALVGFKVVEPGQIVMNRMRAAYGLFAVASVRGLVSPDYAVFGSASDAYNRYLVEVFRLPSLALKFRSESKGLGNGESGFLRLYTDRFGPIGVPYPSIEEQQLIVRFLDWHGAHTAKFVRAKKRLVTLLNEQKRAIIHLAVTRGLDPNAPFKPSGVPWIGSMPINWEVWKIGHLGIVGNGSTPSRGNRAYWAEGTYPWLNSSVVNNSPINASAQFVTNLALAECHLPKVMAGSVVIAITGQGRTRGRAALLAFEATINQHIAFIQLTQARLSSEYLQLVLTAFYEHLRAISDNNGSTRGALTCGDIRRFKIPVPPIEQQIIIQQETSVYTANIDRAITTAEQELGLIGEFRTRLIADVVTGKLDVRAAAASLSEVTELESTVEPADDGDAGEASEDLDDEELAA